MNEEEEYVTPTITPTKESTLKQNIGTLSNREWRQKNITPHLSGGGGPIYDNPLELIGDSAVGLDKATGLHNMRMKIVQPAANIHTALGVAAEVLTPDSTDLIAPGGGYARRIVENAPLGIKLAKKGYESIVDLSQNAKKVWKDGIGWTYELGEDVGKTLEELWQNTQARIRGAQSFAEGGPGAVIGESGTGGARAMSGGGITRSQAEPVTRQLALDLRDRLGGTKEQAIAFQKFQQKAGEDITKVIRALNALALKQEPKNIPEFMEAVEVALGTKVDYRDFIAKGKSITYKSAKGKQIINDLNDLNVALLNRLQVVGGGARSKGHYSLGHIRAVQNLIEQGDVGANRLSNMEPEVLRSVLRLTNANPKKIEEVVEILGNSARKNISDKPSEILTAQGVSRTIDEEYLKFINPKDIGSYWSEILPREHHDWFEDAVNAAVSEKIKFARNLKKVSTVEEGQNIISKMRRTAMDDALNALRPFANTLTEKRAFDLNTVIMKEAPEIILDHIELIKNKIQWVPPKPGHKDWDTMKAILTKNNLSIDDVDTALRTGWRIQEGTSSLKTPLPKLKSKTIDASKLTISEIEARINAGWTVDFNK